MKNKLFSVIIRTKDRLEFLPRAIESVYSQTYSDVEIVIVNDGGADVSRIVNHFKNLETPDGLRRDLILINNKRSVYRASAANIGIEVCNGEYIGFLDDDDYYYNNHLSLHAEVLSKKDAFVSISEGVESLETKEHKGFKELQKNFYFPREINKLSFFFFENYFPFNSICFRKEAVKKVGSLDCKLFVLEDWDFLIRLFLKYEPIVINNVTCAYTTRFGSSNIRMSFEHKKTWHDSFVYVMQKYKDAYKNSQVNIPISEVAEFLSYHSQEWYALTKENEALRDSMAYKLYNSKIYLSLKKIGRKFNLTRG
jgi:glycosyltransferase involved in cell wall biosynthesis